VKKDGSLWRWGKISSGASATPVKIANNVRFAVVGDSYSNNMFVIKEDDSLWVSGNHTVYPYATIEVGKKDHINGELTKVMDNVKTVASYFDSHYVIKKDDSLWSWGRDSTGELGNGGQYDLRGGRSYGGDPVHMLYTYQRTPLKIMENVKRIIPIGIKVYAFTTNEQLWVWGDSWKAEGEMDGNKLKVIKPLEAEKTIPRKCTEEFSYICQNGDSSVILKKDGSLWVKGENEYGQLGTGKTGYVENYTKILTGGVAGQGEINQ
jgi:alpha-tubulin suppressor-like RCC1 family protein